MDKNKVLLVLLCIGCLSFGFASALVVCKYAVGKCEHNTEVINEPSYVNELPKMGQ